MAVVEQLNAKQLEFFEAACAGHNVVLLGKAGTGKTFVLTKVIERLKLSRKVQVVSSSGISSLLFKNAKTLHSFAGIGTCRWEKLEILNHIRNKEEKVKEWIDLDLLVIDEGSMISQRVFETVEFIARSIRKSDCFFGGVQVLFSADFYQLPPVRNEFDNAKFVFESVIYKSMFPHIVHLEEIVRQDEVDFIQFLNDLAEGECNEDHAEFVKEHFSNPIDITQFEGLEYVPKIVCTNNQILIETLEKIETVNSNPFIFKSQDHGSLKYLKKCIAEKQVILKVGVPVMLLYNIDNQLVNGLRGTVIGFKDGNPEVVFDRVRRTAVLSRRTWTFYSESDPHKIVASRTQIPLKVCWAVTAHKAQGETLDVAEVCSGSEFVPGQLYVACSRVRSKEGLYLTGFNLDKLIPPDDSVKKYYETVHNSMINPHGQDLSCCKSICANDLEELELDDYFEWDDEIFTFSANFDVENVVSDDIENVVIDNDDDNDGNMPELPEFDFDLVFASVCENGNLPLFPQNFNIETFFANVKNDVNVLVEDVSGIKVRENKLYELLCESSQTLSFLKLQWHKFLEMFKIKSDGQYERKQFTDFCGELFQLIICDEVLKQFSALVNQEVACLGDEHFTVCTDVLFGLASCFLQVLASRFTTEIQMPFISLQDGDPKEFGKIRYVLGWVFRKIIEHSRRYINDNILSDNKQVRENLRSHILKVKIIDQLIESEAALLKSSAYKESLAITCSKQNRTHGLLNVSDNSFLFGIALEEKRINMLNHNRLNKLKGDLINDSLANVLMDKELFQKWENVCCELPLPNDEFFNECVKMLYHQIVKKYFKMGAGEYLRDFRRDVKWKKSEAHRKKVLMRTEKKEMKSDQVKMNDIRSDMSPGKASSHCQLKAMLIKYPKIFETRLYTVNDIEILLKAYGIARKSGTKSILAARLSEAINNTHDEMSDTTVFA